MFDFSHVTGYIMPIIGALLIALVVFFKDHHSSRNRFFILLNVSGAWWLSIIYIADISNDYDTALIATRIAVAVSKIMAISFLLFCIYFLGSPKRRSLIRNVIIYLPAIIFSLLALSPLMVDRIELSGTGTSIPSASLLYSFDTILLVSYFIAGSVILFWRKSNASSLQKNQINLILVGMLLAIVVNFFTGYLYVLFDGGENINSYGGMSILVFIGLTAYAIVRHKLFDIRSAVVRTIVYGGTLISLALMYYAFAYVVSISLLGGEITSAVSVSPINMVLALALAFLFQPIRQFFDRLSNSIFYRDVYSSEKFFADLSELLASTTDLRGILQRASQEIATTLKSEQCFFFLYYSNATDHHLSSGTKGHARLPMMDARTLDAYVMTHGGEIIMTEMLPEDSNVRRTLISHKIALVMPLRHERRVVGYVCLGDQQSNGYTKRDINVLNTISNELVIAIQNALSVHEVREINATLKQRIDVATKELRATNAQLRHIDTTKDEFVSMASHQLRTPLTSVKGYISMVMEGDAGKISDSQKYLLSEAFESSERMVRLINDFLSVSRLQTGRFIIDKREVDIGKVVGQEVDSLRSIASSHGLRLSYKAPRKPQMIWCDEDKIRQVIMNFIDNAIYYSRADTTIHVTLGIIDNEVIFSVEDTGIGVPIADQPRLFTKFFRAGNARKQRPDGTGVGLFLAKKVVTEHDGKIIFSSTEGQGSVFGFRIPLVTNEQADDSSNNNDNQK